MQLSVIYFVAVSLVIFMMEMEHSIVVVIMHVLLLYCRKEELFAILMSAFSIKPQKYATEILAIQFIILTL